MPEPSAGAGSGEDAFRVALALPWSGPAGMFGLPCRVAAQLAATEIEAGGGVAGRRLEIAHVDAGGPPERVAARVRDLLEGGHIDAVTGWHLSNARQAIADVVTGRVPYVYAAAYEGGEDHDGVLCSGEVPGDQVVAALRWLRAELRLRRWCIVGNDYIWPRGTAARTTAALVDDDLDVVAQRFVPLGTTDDATWTAVLDDVVRHDVDGVLTLLVGSDAARFNRAFSARGLPAAVTRFSPFIDETVLLASGPEATGNLFVSAGWFASLRTASAMEFTGGFTRTFADLLGADPTLGPVAPAPGTMAETTYSALHLLAGLATRSVPSVEDARRTYQRAGWDAPHGTVDFTRGVAHHPVNLAVADGLDLDVVAQVSGRTSRGS